MSVSRLHAMFADACFGDSEAALTGDLRAYLAQHGVAEDDAEAILASPRRLGLYRRLVRHNVVNVVGQMLERTRERLDAHVAGAFDESVAGFMAQQGPRTPHLRDVPSEFLAWAVHEQPADDPKAAPQERATHLLVYRDAAHATRTLDLTPLASAILERLFEGRPLAKAMVEACEATGHALDNDVLGGAARLLADLGERGVLLGARE